MKKNLDKKIIVSLSKKKLFPWLNDCFTDWMVIITVIIIAVMAHHIAMYIFALIVIGNRQHALVLLGHDGTHYTLSANKKFNDFITNFFTFWPLGLTINGYRNLHLQHHLNTGTDLDPELNHKRSRNPQWDLPATRLTVLKYAALDLIGYSLPDYIIVITYSKADKKTKYVPLVLTHVIANALLLFLGLWMVSLLWYASLFTSFMMFFRLRLWLEHQGTADTHRIHLNFIEGMIFAPHHSWLHWEHHNYPTVPYHKLPELRGHLPHPPIMTLSELINFFETSAHYVSGESLKIRNNFSE